MTDLSKLRPGLTGSASVAVEEKNLATHVGSGVAPVFATPMLVALMEAASVDCVEKFLPEGHQSLGVHLDVNHTAPTPAGLTVTTTATLKTIEGRKLIFDVAARDTHENVGSGTHTRVVVATAGFMARVAAKSPPRP
jgi:fluoroacetyl-CoA thioesterase